MEAPLQAADRDASERAEARERTFEEFVLRESTRLFRALYLVTGSRQEAEEIMQDAFIALWQRWDVVGAMEDPTGYLFRTSMNIFRKRLRRTAVALRKAIALFPREESFTAVEDRHLVFKALKELGPSERAAIVLTALLGYPSEEAGRMLGTSAGSVRMQASRARDHMKRTVGEIRDR